MLKLEDQPMPACVLEKIPGQDSKRKIRYDSEHCYGIISQLPSATSCSRNIAFKHCIRILHKRPIGLEPNYTAKIGYVCATRDLDKKDRWYQSIAVLLPVSKWELFCDCPGAGDRRVPWRGRPALSFSTKLGRCHPLFAIEAKASIRLHDIYTYN